MKLMIVDDEKLAADAMARLLNWEELGFDRVYVCYDGEEAWGRLEQGEIDLLLCDIEMPFLDGLELLDRITQSQLKTKTILLTCHANFKYARQAIRMGVTDYLLKPVDEKELLEAVEKTVGTLHTTGGQETAENQELPQALRDACAYIEAHLHEEISREDVAKAVYLHPDYLNRLFNKTFQVSLNRYILEEKMKRAQHLLQSTGLSITEVGSQVGFSNMSAFSQAFRRITGHTPSASRRSK